MDEYKQEENTSLKDAESSKGKEIMALKKKQEEKMTFSEMWAKYPKHVSFIVGNEFCERFSYYGMRSVLLLYLRNYLDWDDDTSTSVYHAFTVMAYLFPLFGAIVADSYWGKYKTIIYLSLVYVLGHIVKTVAAIPYVPTKTAHRVLATLGLFLIAFGTGGIKPCVSSFGGDQFTVDQEFARKQFFSMFYFAINAGSLISTFLTPIFRADVDCYPNEEGPEFDECYALAFGVPAALMILALLLFVAGSKWYIIYPPEGSIFIKFCKCIGSACLNKWKTPREKRNKTHWLEYAEATPRLIRDTKYVLRVLVLFLPLPFFWALFDQQGTRWTIQAIQTNGHLGNVLIKPDQVETLNPLLIVTLIPLFEVTLYPALRYFKVPFPPLRRMTVGLILAGVSFVAAAILQIEIDKTLTSVPKHTKYGIRFINTLQCNITVSPEDYDDVIIQPSTASKDIFFYEQGTGLDFYYVNCNDTEITHTATTPNVEEVVDAVIDNHGVREVQMIVKKPEDGGGRFSVVNFDDRGRTLWIHATAEDGEKLEHPIEVEHGERSKTIDFPRGNVVARVYDDETLENTTFIMEIKLFLSAGAVYSIWFENDRNNFITNDINPNVVSVIWMVPQFVIITVGEVFLSITGLEFSYTQAPPSMKSVLSSIWLFTVSLGNVIVIIIAEAKGIEKQSNEFLLFAGLIFIAALIFIYLAYRYVPVDENEFAEELADERKKMREKAAQHRRRSSQFKPITNPTPAYQTLENETPPPI